MDQAPIPPFILFSRTINRTQIVLHGHFVQDPDLMFRIELVVQTLDNDNVVVASRHFVWDV